MKIADLIERKKELGYTNEMISEKSGVPLSTVNKILGGFTERPRYNTLQSLECVLFPELHSPKEAALYKDIVENLALDWGRRASDGLALDEYSSETPKKIAQEHYEKVISWKKPGEFTVDDWLSLPGWMNMELIDGVLIDRNTPTTKHQFIVTYLCTALNIAIEASKKKNKDCIVLSAPTSVQPDKDDDKNGFIPDVLMVCDKEKYRGTDIILGPPDYITEVLSPSTEKYDRIVKLNKYWMAGVREYWIINIEENEIYVYHFDKGASFKTYSFEDEIPLGISGGEITIDFNAIYTRLKSFFGE